MFDDNCLAEHHDDPYHGHGSKTQHDGRAADVFCKLGKFVVVERDPVDCGLDRGIEQFYNEHEDDAGQKKSASGCRHGQQPSRRYQHCSECDFLAKRVFEAVRRAAR